MQKSKQSMQKSNFYNLMLFCFLLLSFGVVSFSYPHSFLTVGNFSTMSGQIAEVGILTLAMSIVIISGGIDLSIVSIMNLSAIAATLLLKQLNFVDVSPFHFYFNVTLVIVVLLSVGLCAGALNGFIVGKLNVPPILATLATMLFLGGINKGITNGETLVGLPQFIRQFAQSSIFGLNPPFVLFILVCALILYLMSRNSFGHKTYLIGHSRLSFAYSGMNANYHYIKVYMLSGLLASLTGFILLLKTNSASATYGESYVLTVILIAVIGGLDVMGGKGKISSVILAILLLRILSTGFNTAFAGVNGSNFFIDFIWGGLLIAILILRRLFNNPLRTQ